MALVSGAIGACREAWCAAVAAASMDGLTGDALIFVPARQNMHMLACYRRRPAQSICPVAIRSWCSQKGDVAEGGEEEVNRNNYVAGEEEL